MPKVHVLSKKEDLDSQQLHGKVVIVLDILFATTSAVAVLAAGALEVLPLPDRQACLDQARLRADDSCILSGELDARTLQGFVDATPLALLRQQVAGRSMLYSTTNGTVALRQAAGADHVYAAALLNARAVIEHILQAHPDQTILIVCAGSANQFNLEDFYGAGRLVNLIAQSGGERYELTDAARAAALLQGQYEPLAALAQSEVGRYAFTHGFGAEVEYAARLDCVGVVPKLASGSLRPL